MWESGEVGKLGSWERWEGGEVRKVGQAQRDMMELPLELHVPFLVDCRSEFQMHKNWVTIRGRNSLQIILLNSSFI